MKKIVQKGNKQLHVAEERLSEFLNAGYQEVDQKTGKVVGKKPADELKALKAENTQLKKANKELNEKVAELTEKLASAGSGSAAE